MSTSPAQGDSRATNPFALGEREVELYQPTDGQMVVIFAIIDILDEPDVQQQVEALNNFGTVMRYLFVKEEDRRYMLGSMARGSLDLPDYFQLAQDIVQHWAPEEASNREERRAQARKAPAKKAATRVPARRSR
jgi:hypothetical protein